MARAEPKGVGNILRSAVGSPPVIAAIVVLLLLIFSRSLSFIEWRAYDLLWKLTPASGLDERVVVIDMGKNNAEYDPYRPAPVDGGPTCSCDESTPRAVYAEAVNRLADWGAKVVVFDLYFSRACPLEDPALAEAFKDAGNVVVAATTEIISDVVLFDDPASGLGKEDTAWAVASPVASKPNQDIRSVPMRIIDVETRDRLALSLQGFMRFAGVGPEEYEMAENGDLLVAGARVPLLSGEEIPLLRPGGPTETDTIDTGVELKKGSAKVLLESWHAMLINWSGPPGTIEPMPMTDVLEMGPEMGRAAFEGKAVIIGDEEWDQKQTAVGPMPGPQIQANALHTLISGRFIRPTNQWLYLLWLLLLGSLSSWSVRRIKALRTPYVLALLLMLSYGLAQQLLSRWQILHYPFFSIACVGASWGATLAVHSGALGNLLRRLVPKFMAGTGAQDLREIRTTEATVLFSDIRNFTTISEKLGAESMMGLIGEYRRQVEKTIGAHGGTIVVTPGDAILAVFWQDHDGANHATSALRSGREVLTNLPEWATSWEAEGVPLDIGVGINTGTVAMGALGEEDMHVTVIGDAVNVAARLESLTKDLGRKLIFGDETRLQLQEEVDPVFLDEVTVKGREEPLKVYGVPDPYESAEAPQ